MPTGLNIVSAAVDPAPAADDVTVLNVTDREAAYPDWQGLDEVHVVRTRSLSWERVSDPCYARFRIDSWRRAP